MARLNIGMEGGSIDLESLRRLVALADWLDFPDSASVSSNLQQIFISITEAEIKWDKVVGP